MLEKRKVFKTVFYIVLIALVLTYISRPLVSIQQVDSETGELVDAVLLFEPKIDMVLIPGFSYTIELQKALQDEESTIGLDNKKSPDYTLTVSGKEISLFDWEDEVDLNAIFGESLSEETKKLENADTFTGSFLKTITFKNTEVKLFSPKGDGKRFYVLELQSSSDDLRTYRGIQVGYSLESLQETYPEVKRSLDGTTGRDGEYELLFDHDPYTYLKFRIQDDLVTKIRLYHEFS